MPTASVAWKSSTSFYLHDKYATFYAHYFAPPPSARESCPNLRSVPDASPRHPACLLVAFLTPLERHIRATRLYLSMLVVRNPTTRCPAALRPLSASPPPPPRPPTPSCPALSRVRPSSHRHPVHSPSFLMLGSYSRCAARAIPLSLSLFLFGRSLSPRSVYRALRFWLFLAVTASPSLVLFRKKKKRT